MRKRMSGGGDGTVGERRSEASGAANRTALAMISGTADSSSIVADAMRKGALADLAAALGREPDEEEAVTWATMAPDNRELTLARIRVLQRWVGDRGDLTAAQAADQAQLKISRFYDLAAKWARGERRMFDAGRYVRSQADRKGQFDAELLNELQAAAPAIVRAEANRNASVASMVELLVGAVDARARRLPKFNTLREIVERERRRLNTRAQAGTQPGFDIVGTGLLRADGRHHLMFGVIDRTSRLVLGFALGEFDASLAGHAAAAIEAASMVARPEFAGVPWAGATERIDIVPGSDADAWDGIALDACPVECGFASGPRSRGGYFRRAVGAKLGGLRLSSVRTALEPREVSADDEVFDEDAAWLRVRVEVAAHNAAVRAEMDVEGEAVPPPTLLATLDWFTPIALAATL